MAAPSPNEPSSESTDTMPNVRDVIEKISFVKQGFAAIGEYIHPNQITASRLPLVLAAIGLKDISQITAGTLYAIALTLDWFDGAVARAMPNGKTVEGTKLDQLIDKAGNIPLTAVLIAQYSEDTWLAISGALSMLVDFRSLLQRGNPIIQIIEGIRGTIWPSTCTVIAPDDPSAKKIEANWQGKVKMFLQSISLLAILVAGQIEEVRTAGAIGMGVSAVLGVWGMVKRMLWSDGTEKKE